MALNVGELVGFASLETRDLDRGANHVTAVMQGLAGDVTRTSEQAGTGAGQGLIGRMVDQIRAGAAQAAQGLANALTPGSAAAGDQAGTTAAAALQAQLDAGARQAGASAGTALDGALGSEARAAGSSAGDEAGTALNTSLESEADQAGADAGEAAGMSLKTKLVAGAAVAGAAAGAVMFKGITEGFAQDLSADMMNAALGSTPAHAKVYAKAAGDIYKSTISESFDEAAQLVKVVMGAGLIDPDASVGQIKKISAAASDMSRLFDQDVTMSVKAAASMIKTGLAKDATEAFDVMTAGFRDLGAPADDLSETFYEYSPFFKQFGLDAKQSLGVMKQGLDAGAWSTDKIGDAFKEFSLRMTAAKDETKDNAFKAMGLDFDTMQAKIAKGGEGAREAMALIMDKLRGVKDAATQAQIVQDLFGGPGEDLGASIFALNLDTAGKGLDNVAGSADRAGDTMRNNASTKIEAFKRTLEQAFIEVLGNKVLPRVIAFGREMKQEFGPAVKDAGRWVRDDLVPVLRDVAGWLNDYVVPAAVATGRVVRDDVVPAMKDAATWIGNNKEPLLGVAAAIMLFLLPAMVAAGVGATVSAATQVTAWVLTKTTATTSAATSVAAHWATIGGWIAAGAQAVVSGAVIVGQWILMGTQATIRGAQMAAAWIVALGPIAWVTVAVIAIAALVIYYWDEIVAGTQRAWGWVRDHTIGAASALWGWIRDTWSSASGWVGEKTRAVGTAVINAFAGMVTGAQDKGRNLVDWLRGLPGDLLRALGDTGRLLWDAGTRILQGLIDGVMSKLGSLKSALGSVTSMIPDWKGPATRDAKLLTGNGKLIMRGFMAGIDSQTPALRAQLGALTASMPSMAAPARITSVGGTTPVAESRTGPLVQINGGWHSSGEDPERMAEALDWRLRGR
ncbi:phage tail tape measure protein [Embleya sp. NBC_00888]|uniref:phage tail tape measure protein n=1 Tax=Embleya sp. NBC_00888 TaxID=2975960 RepID=UPI00386F6429|nr:phage tail tape measure protein [Embleya sp. NBC_00888]